MVVGELAGFGGEAEVGDGGHFVVWDFEAEGPFVFGFVEEV